MSFDKHMGKERRKQYHDSRRFDTYCRNHGVCAFCSNNRQHFDKKRRSVADDELRQEELKMWIKRENGSLLNLDNGLLITSRATGCSPDAEHGYEISVVIVPIDDILNFTKIVTFNKREYADKYIDSLAKKLGAINYDDV